MSELKRGHAMGRLRVRRLPQVRLAVACKVIACNVKRWLRASAAQDNGSSSDVEHSCAIFLAFTARLSAFFAALASFGSSPPTHPSTRRPDTLIRPGGSWAQAAA